MRPLCLAFTLLGKKCAECTQSEVCSLNQKTTSTLCRVYFRSGRTINKAVVWLDESWKKFRLFRQALRQKLTSETSDIH